MFEACPCRPTLSENELAIIEEAVQGCASVSRGRTVPSSHRITHFHRSLVGDTIRHRPKLGDFCTAVDTTAEGASPVPPGSVARTLLREVGPQPKPAQLKRGRTAIIEEWLNAAEYV